MSGPRDWVWETEGRRGAAERGWLGEAEQERELERQQREYEDHMRAQEEAAHQAEVESLRRENERLRTALRDVLMGCAGYLRRTDARLLADARAALAPPPASSSGSQEDGQ
jgi:hypothetical protein